MWLARPQPYLHHHKIISVHHALFKVSILDDEHFRKCVSYKGVAMDFQVDHRQSLAENRVSLKRSLSVLSVLLSKNAPCSSPIVSAEYNNLNSQLGCEKLYEVHEFTVLHWVMHVPIYAQIALIWNLSRFSRYKTPTE